MELRALRYFVVVAEELHFGRAAERLHIVQPAVSQQIARLERELDLRLFDRSTRRVRLTAAGRELLGQARETLAAAERVRTRARALRSGSAGTMRIGTGPDLTAHAERGVAALRVVHPDIEPVLVDRPVCARLEGVREGELDFALVRGVEREARLRVLPVWTEELYAVLPTGHALSGGGPVSLADLAALPFRHPAYERDAPLHDAVTRAFEAAGVRPVLGRPAGTVPDTLIEIGTGPASWTLASAEVLAAWPSPRVTGVPLSPPLEIPGGLVASERFDEKCVQTAVDAFSTP
ncbi:LysR family transcriptional regulator [Streptomyces sp. SB3404]|uniref:LysR family transcriptional regulator n=1 Tax=Streptomyces boncukensis TaxID=2711219 RepID=A0A6G4X7V9_9ACTN|nr:LysR family transcriptional regulator [Streptomyces boncukensis]